MSEFLVTHWFSQLSDDYKHAKNCILVIQIKCKMM